MSEMTLADVSKAMREIDFAMLSTRTEGGAIAARPMSNNRDVEFDGDTYFFTYEKTRTVEDIERGSEVGLSYVGSKGVLGGSRMFISIEGSASLIRDKAAFSKHWAKSLDEWFPDGVDTPGIVLIKVHAERIHYWKGMDEGEFTV
ncbi:pyridoxamine 5'-phosphate oxidase family protein [Amorphus coralli]|uniref:pyridoxamine 5'-phosphate oxidase family protein n=1 Tax=Amorphus coralli TaxID=340680 RepID=UPI00036EE7A8|nr:pyridoxamine 5'-phosphate oxidase family protein [Amorphus coralli]